MFSFDFVQIPESTVTIGSDEFKYTENIFWNEEERQLLAGKWLYPFKEHDALLTEYYISKYEITNRDFKLFLDAVNKKLLVQKKRDPDNVYWKNIEQNERDWPVRDTSVFEVLAYCQWLSDQTGDVIRLPTSAEWEYAAMGDEKKKYPWGNDQKILESLGTNKQINPDDFPVGTVPENISPFGVMGMYGASEIVLDLYNDNQLDPQYAFINPLHLLSETGTFTVRGSGEYNDFNDYAGLYNSTWSSFDYPFEQSFRIVKDVGTIFNKDTEDECVFFQSQGYFLDDTDIYILPSEAMENAVDTRHSFEKCLVLFKHEQGDDVWYRVYYPKEGQYGTKWFSGWVEADKIELTQDRWYGTLWDWYQSANDAY